MAETVRVRLSGPLFEQGGNLLARRIAARFDYWMAYGLKYMIAPKLRPLIPVRTGRLKRSLHGGRSRTGAGIYFKRQGFYWHFQSQLPKRLDRRILSMLRPLIKWAFLSAVRDAFRL